MAGDWIKLPPNLVSAGGSAAGSSSTRGVVEPSAAARLEGTERRGAEVGGQVLGMRKSKVSGRLEIISSAAIQSELVRLTTTCAETVSVASKGECA